MNSFEKVKNALHKARGILGFLGCNTEYIDEALNEMKTEELSCKKCSVYEESDTFFHDIAKCVEQTNTFDDACEMYEKENMKDAGLCAESCISIWLSESTNRRNETAKVIQQYAESYHACECAKRNKG